MVTRQGLIPVEAFGNVVADTGVCACVYECVRVCGGHFGDQWVAKHLH